MKNILTIDWEEWNDTASMKGRGVHPGAAKTLQPATELVLDMVSPYTATFFVLACHAQKHSDLIRQISRRGHEIALHGLRHVSLQRYSPVAFREDILTAKKILEDITGSPVTGFRAPNFSMGPDCYWAMDVLVSCGFEYDASMSASVFSRVLARGPLPLREIPRSGVGPGLFALPFGGGGFLRVYPYGWTRSWIHQLNARSLRAMVYVHPWELDGSWMKERGLPWRARLVMGAGHSLMRGKLSRLLKDFQFGSVKEILKEEMGKERL